MAGAKNKHFSKALRHKDFVSALVLVRRWKSIAKRLDMPLDLYLSLMELNWRKDMGWLNDSFQPKIRRNAEQVARKIHVPIDLYRRFGDRCKTHDLGSLGLDAGLLGRTNPS